MFRPGEVVIQKYGGSSMASVERIEKVAARIAESASKGRRVAVVVSAMGDTTDDLLSLVNSVYFDPDRRETDQILATGEIVSAALAATALKKLGVRARSFNASSLGILTNSKSSDQKNQDVDIIRFERAQKLQEFLQPGSVAVVAGFQGVNSDGDLTTIGRGGSDISAVVLARELGQKVCEKFTDEDGVYTADPRLISGARKIWHLRYDEMLSLAENGNGILHPRAIGLARECNIRIHVRSSFSKSEGSIIGPDGDSSLPVKSLTCDNKQSLVCVEGLNTQKFSSEEFETTAPMRIKSLQLISDPNCRCLRLTFPRADSFDAMPFIWGMADGHHATEVKFDGCVTVVSLVGTGFLETHTNLAENYLSFLEKQGIYPLLFQKKGVRLCFVLPASCSEQAISLLHGRLVSRN